LQENRQVYAVWARSDKGFSGEITLLPSRNGWALFYLPFAWKTMGWILTCSSLSYHTSILPFNSYGPMEKILKNHSFLLMKNILIIEFLAIQMIESFISNFTGEIMILTSINIKI
jgi:hypothetical protein